MAHSGQLPGIPGYQRLELDLNSRNISFDDTIKAAGKELIHQMRSQLRSSLRTVVDFN